MLLSRPRLRRLVRPMPPTPTPAMLSRSLGGVWPRPSTCRGTIVTAAVVAAAFFTKSRLEIMAVSSWRSTFAWSLSEGWPCARMLLQSRLPAVPKPMQIIRGRTLHDVVIIGSGAGGGMAAKVLTEAGANVLMLEAGADVRHAPRFENDGVALPVSAARPASSRAPVRRVRRRLGRLDARRRALHHCARRSVRLVPHADAWRTDESLGPHLAAVRPRRFPPQEP